MIVGFWDIFETCTADLHKQVQFAIIFGVSDSMRERLKERRGNKMTRAVRCHRFRRVVKRVERFGGDEWLTSEAGLVSYLRRFYRPDHGRWLNRDPIEERGGANLYGFCANTPALYWDGYGLAWEFQSSVIHSQFGFPLNPPPEGNFGSGPHWWQQFFGGFFGMYGGRFHQGCY